MQKTINRPGFTLLESLVMLALIIGVAVVTVSLLRKDYMGVDTTEPVDTPLHDLLNFGGDADDTGVTIEGLPPAVEGPATPDSTQWRGELNPPAQTPVNEGTNPPAPLDESE